jgi:hypothetical protein
MRNSNWTALGLLTGLVLGGVTGCAVGEPKEMTAELWREDLRYLAEKLPAKHGNAFHQVSRSVFEQAVSRLDEQIPSLDRHELLVELGRIVAMIGDGHTELWLTQQATGFRRYPLALSFFGEDLYVFAATEDHVDAVGSKVLRIGDTPVDEAYRRVVPLIARDNDYEYLRSAPIYLVVPEILHAAGVIDDMETAVWTLGTNDGETTIDTKPLSHPAGASWKTARELAGGEAALYFRQREAHYWYEYLADSRTLYVKYNKCKNQPGQKSIKRFARELFAFADSRPVERFVVDLRHNTGGNFHRNRPLIDGVLERPALNRRGRLFVITSRTTFSAATIAAIDFKRETEALVVGEPSRGRPNGYSDEKHLQLPNSRIEVNYSPLYREAMPELGDAPHLPVDLAVANSFEDYRNGRDRVLEAILGYGTTDAAAAVQSANR